MASFSMKRFRLYAREVIAATLCLTALGIAAGVFGLQTRPGLYRLTISGRQETHGFFLPAPLACLARWGSTKDVRPVGG